MENLLEQYLEKYFETKDQNFMDFAEEVIGNELKNPITKTSYEYIYGLKKYNINLSSSQDYNKEWKINIRKIAFIRLVRKKLEYSINLPHKYLYKELNKASRRCINSDFYSPETKRVYYLKNKYNKY